VLRQALVADSLGSMLLAATVIGSGIMAERLAGGNLAVELLANTAATVAVLATLIALLGPISGAHFNPAVSIVESLRGKLTLQTNDLLCGRSNRRLLSGRNLGARDVRLAIDPSIFASADRSRAMALRSSCHRGVDPRCDGSAGPNEAAWRVSAWIGCGLLVYSIDVVRQSRHYDRAVSQ